MLLWDAYSFMIGKPQTTEPRAALKLEVGVTAGAY